MNKGVAIPNKLPKGTIEVSFKDPDGLSGADISVFRGVNSVYIDNCNSIGNFDALSASKIVKLLNCYGSIYLNDLENVETLVLENCPIIKGNITCLKKVKHLELLNMKQALNGQVISLPELETLYISNTQFDLENCPKLKVVRSIFDKTEKTTICNGFHYVAPRASDHIQL